MGNGHAPRRSYDFERVRVCACACACVFCAGDVGNSYRSAALRTEGVLNERSELSEPLRHEDEREVAMEHLLGEREVE